MLILSCSVKKGKENGKKNAAAWNDTDSQMHCNMSECLLDQWVNVHQLQHLFPLYFPTGLLEQSCDCEQNTSVDCYSAHTKLVSGIKKTEEETVFLKLIITLCPSERRERSDCIFGLFPPTCCSAACEKKQCVPACREDSNLDLNMKQSGYDISLTCSNFQANRLNLPSFTVWLLVKVTGELTLERENFHSYRFMSRSSKPLFVVGELVNSANELDCSWQTCSALREDERNPKGGEEVGKQRGAGNE